MLESIESANRQAAQRFESRRQERRANKNALDRLRQGKEYDWTKIEQRTRLAERARRLGMFEEAGRLMRDADEKTGRRVLEQIIAANNLLGITFLLEGARMSRAVGRIKLPVPGGTRLGTGFMVSPRVMMTNNHVLGDRIEAGNAVFEFDFYRREDGTTGPIKTFRLQPGALFVTDIPLDFTVVAVRESNGGGDSVGERGWFPLVGPSGKAVVGERVSIIQHPNGEPQQVTVHDNKIVDVAGDFLHYETDTMGGSSGSPVLNINWDLAALHHAAVDDKNEGIRVSSIVSRLREIFASEASGSTADEVLATELMSGVGPELPPVDWHSPLNGLPAPLDAPPLPLGPKVNADGTTSWVVPVSVTLGVGQPGGRGDGFVGADRAGSLPADEPSPTEDADLTAAIQALEDAEGRVYYSKTQDRAAIEDYYPDLDGLDAAQLYRTLSELLDDTHTTTLSYKKARLTHLYPWIDRRDGSGRELRGIYSNDVFDALEVIRREAEMERLREQAIRERMRLEAGEPVDEAFLEELEATFPFNCEHVVPQSWFNKRKQPKTDLHHLFTCESKCNSFRGNHAYFDFPAEAFREDCGRRENGKFEPKGGKGAVARATLYFLLRYPSDIADSNKEMPKDRLKTLIQWAKGDKVDRWERHRNAEIQKVQGNRNPLIDFPQLVDRVDFGMGWA